MTNTKKIIAGIVMIAVVIIGVGYAAIQNVTLNIAGSAVANPSQNSFKIAFSGEPTVSDSTKVTAAVTDDLNATLNVSGLTTKGETVTATYIIQNTSTDLSTRLSAIVSNSNTEYFDVTYSFDSASITKAEATTITVKVELIKIPIDQTVSSTVGVQITAEPIQPE